MKKILFICYLTMCLACCPTKAVIANSNNEFQVSQWYSFNNAKQSLPYEYTQKEGSIEELYKDIIVTLIEPCISKEVEKYYGQPLLYDLFDVKLLRSKSILEH